MAGAVEGVMSEGKREEGWGKEGAEGACEGGRCLVGVRESRVMYVWDVLKAYVGGM